MDLNMIIKTLQTKNPLLLSKKKKKKSSIWQNNLAVTSKGHSKIRACGVRDGKKASKPYAGVIYKR